MNIFNTSIKSILLLFIFLFPSFIMAQSPVILDKITTLDSYKKLYEANTFDHNNSYFKSNDKGQWNNIPIKEVYFYKDYFMCSIDTSVKNTAKRLASYLEKNYPDNLIVEEGYYERTYTVVTRAFRLDFTAKVKEDTEVLENTKGELSIKFKKVEDNPLANLSDELKVNRDGIICLLKIECYNVVPAIFADGIPVLSRNTEDKYSRYETIELNKYILTPDIPIDLSFIFTPGIDKKGQVMSKVPKSSYAKIAIEYVNVKGDLLKTVNLFDNEAYVTDTIVNNGKTQYYHYTGTNDYTKKNIQFSHQLKAPVEYKLTGWSEGKDLRKEKNLEERIKQFYADYAALIMDKNIARITQLLYPSFLEKYTYNYNGTKLKSYTEYSYIKYMLNNSFKVVTAQTTKLHISTNGQLAFLESLDKTTYLKAVGLDQIENISFLFYIDKNTNELKIIR
ncbi:hypothetical protein [Myroides profundi]|uniref:DUF3857 domain-containing protein n=1 Tax=Myroides profundi TaxID=480520 RepID=A0AAJ5BF46_MYRPR|nr:hypothetical protein [Myroides profundi]AJH15106.1 hypothetical protein MPR_1931 [Myroides profundi]SER43900.1 hypothetical protein SAMN04488089_1165 [Myroides profundi]